jgi:hypothetical protein
MNRTELGRFRVKCDTVVGLPNSKNSPCSYLLGSTTCYNYEQIIQNQMIRYTYCDNAIRAYMSPFSFCIFLLALISWRIRP